MARIVIPFMVLLTPIWLLLFFLLRLPEDSRDASSLRNVLKQACNAVVAQ